MNYRHVPNNIEVSIVGMASGEKIIPYKSYLKVKAGKHEARDLIKEDKKGSLFFKWLNRVLIVGGGIGMGLYNILE